MAHDLDRFVSAQAASHAQALAELRSGRKTGHWMWFVFPQIAGLGHSAMARTYAIADLAEARAYLAHPVLGPRLIAATAAAVAAAGDAEAIFGPVDAMKLRSSMTLFAAAADDDDAPFVAALARFFAGIRDPATIALLDAR
ncbi:DUF1810 domain-containing protein [Sphingomonas sp. A2-49]|uniref:DUF1810 domain-containing protein n=1 Tax=Sphingomonas sp. A2-49 TaxID=1391375 RepID=UPI0021D02A1E|nr:DUF1810 domain-containing protein [Sphingomonas sp. A2-49]MCU6454903.1 DUF1810 domain-containing protein [Sphingomonas sp. A2-49]